MGNVRRLEQIEFPKQVMSGGFHVLRGITRCRFVRKDIALRPPSCTSLLIALLIPLFLGATSVVHSYKALLGRIAHMMIVAELGVDRVSLGVTNLKRY